MSASAQTSSQSQRDHERRLKEFTKGASSLSVPEIVGWTLRFLRDISDGLFDPTRKFKSLHELRTAFNDAHEEAWNEHLWWLESDKLYMSDLTYRDYLEGHKDPNEHPWGRSTLDDCLRWLEESPETVFVYAERIEQFAADHAREYALSIMNEDDDGGLSSRLDKFYHSLVEQILSDYEGRRAWNG